MGVASGDREGRTTKILIGLMGVFLAMAVYAGGLAAIASGVAHDAVRRADQVANDLSIHEARQNGSLERIDSQLGTLRGYHSTHRGEHKEDRKIMDELLRHSYKHSSSVP